MGSGVKLEWIRILSSSFFVLYDLKSISYACPAGCLTFTWSRLSSYSFVREQSPLLVLVLVLLLVLVLPLEIHLVQIVFLFIFLAYSFVSFLVVWLSLCRDWKFICAWAESAPPPSSTSAAFVWKRSWSSCKRRRSKSGRSSDTSEKQHCAKKEEKVQIDKCILSQGWSVKHLTEATYCDICQQRFAPVAQRIEDWVQGGVEVAAPLIFKFHF